jgi:hypothetical protein
MDFTSVKIPAHSPGFGRISTGDMRLLFFDHPRKLLAFGSQGSMGQKMTNDAGI